MCDKKNNGDNQEKRSESRDRFFEDRGKSRPTPEKSVLAPAELPRKKTDNG